jgi:hypothetical protein
MSLSLIVYSVSDNEPTPLLFQPNLSYDKQLIFIGSIHQIVLMTLIMTQELPTIVQLDNQCWALVNIPPFYFVLGGFISNEQETLKKLSFLVDEFIFLNGPFQGDIHWNDWFDDIKDRFLETECNTFIHSKNNQSKANHVLQMIQSHYSIQQVALIIGKQYNWNKIGYRVQ